MTMPFEFVCDNVGCGRLGNAGKCTHCGWSMHPLRGEVRECPRCHRVLAARLVLEHSGMCTSCTSAPPGPVSWAIAPAPVKPPPRRLVYLESPFAGDRQRNAAYLKAAMRDSLDRGEAPFASHALYVQFVDDDVPVERAMGIEAGLAWGLKAEATVVYIDLGISPGMQQGIDHAIEVGRTVEQRLLRWTYVPEKIVVCMDCQSSAVIEIKGSAMIPYAPICSRCAKPCVKGHWLLDNPAAARG